MRTGVHGDRIAAALAGADLTYLLSPTDFSLMDLNGWEKPPHVCSSTNAIVDAVSETAQPGDAVLVMSNRGFETIHERLIAGIHRVASAL